MNNFIQYGNKFFKLVSTYPLLQNQNYYVIKYEEFTLLHFLRRTTPNKYEVRYTTKSLCVDLSTIGDKKSHLMVNWGVFITQAIEYEYNKLSALQSMVLEANPRRLSDSNGEMELYTIYTDSMNYNLVEFSTIFDLYTSLLLRLDINPSRLSLAIDSGYDSKTGTRSTIYYNIHNFNTDLFDTENRK